MRSNKNKKENTTQKTPISKGLIFKRIIEVFIGIILVAVISVGVYACVVISKAPPIDTENITDLLAESTVIYDANGNEIDTVYSNSDRTNVEYKDLPENLVNAFVALEDKTFWEHHGFNFVRMAGAIVESVFTDNGISGTSTITQQLSRNLFLPDERFERTIGRKIVEAYYAAILEKELTKEEIMEAYLNTIDFGYHSSGVQAASQAYFSKDVQDLTLAQCAALAPLAQSPTGYALVQFVNNEEVSPDDKNILNRTLNGTFIANDASKHRRETCLSLMKDQGYINEKQYNRAVKKSLKNILNPSYTTPTGEAAYFADYVISQVLDDLMEVKGWDYDTALNAVYNGGLRIHSTLDSEAQDIVETTFDNPANFPQVETPTDGAGNIVINGNVVLYDYDNYFDSEGNFTLNNDEVTVKDDGSIVIHDGHRLNIYNTEVNGTSDYSVEFKSMYTYEEGLLFSISGGFINIPQAYKTRNNNGDVTVSAQFMKDSPDFFRINEDGTVTIPISSYTLNQKVVQPQAAMTIVENSTGHIKAMVGGRMTTGRMLHNRATSPRQPGSSIKPLGVYGAAIQQSLEEVKSGKKHKFVDFGIDKQGAKFWGDYITPASIVVDEKTTVEGRPWPKNVFSTFEGPVTLRNAMAKSINTCAVKTFFQVGTDYSYDTVERFGISTLTDNDRNPAALALGGMSSGVSTLEMASAYTVFPNNGTRVDTTSYTKVLDRNGKEILSSKKAETHKVLDPGVAWIMKDMLQYVVESGNAAGAAISGVQTGGKTGTTDEQVDLWFDGFTPNYSASLWMGCDQNLTLLNYSTFTAEIWGNIMNQISAAKSGSYPSMPSNVTSKNGEYFINGTQSGLVNPKKLEKTFKICKDSGYLATPDCKHVEEEKYLMYDGSKKPPKFYCHLHNSNPLEYPINPDEVLVVPDKPDDNKKPDTTHPGNDSDNGSGEHNDNGNNVTPEKPVVPDSPVLPEEDDESEDN